VDAVLVDQLVRELADRQPRRDHQVRNLARYQRT
jgi:hypothetical protein